MTNEIVIVYGPQASRKTRHSKALMQLYGCSRIIEEWAGEQPLQDGDLALTNLEPPFNLQGTTIRSIVTAKQELQNAKGA